MSKTCHLPDHACRLLLPLLLLAGHISAQLPSESHQFITYDTTINLGYGPNLGYVWLARVTRPAKMFGHDPDAGPRPAIIFMSGQAEVGTNAANLRVNGPHYWLDHGWDGGLTLGNGRHYPIIITLQPAFQYPQTPEIANILARILHIYHINRKAVHLCGLSQGAFAWTAMICYQTAPGQETGMKLATSIVALQGASCNTTPATEKFKLPGWTSFGHWAAKYHGRFFGLEGVADYRNVSAIEKNMNDSLPGCAYFSYEKYGGGAHCCWNDMLNPAVKDWQCTGDMTNLNLQRNAAPNTAGTYRPGTNIFQWMLQQGDSSLVTPSVSNPQLHSGKSAFHHLLILPSSSGEAPLVIRKVAVAEYRVGYLYSDSNFYSMYDGRMIRYNFGDRKIIDVGAGFNLMLALDDQGFVWTSLLRSPLVERIETDASGAPFNKNTAFYGYANTHTSIRSDGSLWYWGDDTFHLFHSSGPLNLRPTRLSPQGMRVSKCAMGFHRFAILTSDGQIWEWLRGKGTAPTRIPIPRPAIDVFVSQWDFAGCIIPDPGEPPIMGYPWIWGTATGIWGGKAPAIQPVSVKKLWQMKAPVREISVSYHTIHFIDSLGRLFGIGDNVMGEVGNGHALVNQFNYPGFYGWTWQRDEDLTGTPPIQIDPKIRWKHLYADNFLAFYRYATDADDNLYFWGRDKALVSGRGYLNLQEAAHPDAMNVLKPTIVHPLSAIYQSYNFTMPAITAGTDRTVSSDTAILQATVTPPLLIKSTPVAANGIDTIGYKIVSYKWTRTKGAACKIVDPDSRQTIVTGLTSGKYTFTLIAKDNNEGTASANVTITVNPVAVAGNTRYPPKKIGKL